MDLKPWYDARNQIVSTVTEELMGPVDLTALDEPPLNRILVGILHPQVNAPPQFITGLEEEMRVTQGGVEGEDTESHAPVAQSRSVTPSSMGMTFSVDLESVPTIRVQVSARRYECEDDVWLPVDVDSGDGYTVSPADSGRFSFRVGTEHLEVVGVVRPAIGNVARVTVSLVNLNGPSDAKVADASCWFRPQIEVSLPSGEFIDRRRVRSSTRSDADSRSSAFLYRDEPVLAIGHGCAVTWEEEGAPTRLVSTFLPQHDVKLAKPAGGDHDDIFGKYELDMERLANGEDRAQLVELVSSYERWINSKRSEAESIEGDHRNQALEHIELATQCAGRIRAGIKSLNSRDVSRAFELMNKAMVEQRSAQDRARGARPGKQRWRPFQLAFILMNLPALADESHPDREVVDLLWFPTGGGKTEAYLGCIGFSILLRRLRNSGNGGVSAIMRYTLRLLTRQQFERASGLICALEIIRREELPSSVPVSLGLWVGNSATPNKVKDAKSILNRMASGLPVEGSTPVQLLRCSWCGSKLDYRDYYVIDNAQMEIRCSSSHCDFADGLPLYVTDEDIYRVRPSLLIGTVDKFAMMTWREEVGELFSIGGTDSAPDMIVQDELHLISGPLGTIVGLYESALDMAFSSAGRPKVLASTATIRRAEEQIKNVFARTSVQFPPPGLSPDDNYFAVDAEASQKGTRKYFGILSPGTSQATLLVRVYSALLQAVDRLDVTDEVRDHYWTLLGYFNSLRILGSTYLQVLDDVPSRIEVIAKREQVEPRSISSEPVELTSRVDQTRIPEAMTMLETSLPDERSPDIALATNMISVGLDIDRLGMMVVAGQPQSASEYIQSTSRVGRKFPGLVMVVFNGHRSRDISHFESFVPFHRALYREVEATTATPFASRARDRGAHGTLVAAVRMVIGALRSDASAKTIADHRAEVQSVIDRLVARAEVVSPDEADAYRDQLEKLVDNWIEGVSGGLVDRYGSLRYPGAAPKSGDRPLLTDTSGNFSRPDSYPVSAPPWPSLSSMRDVDAETSLFVKYFKIGDDNNGGS